MEPVERRPSRILTIYKAIIKLIFSREGTLPIDAPGAGAGPPGRPSNGDD